MDDVGRLCKGLLMLLVLSFIMGFFTACGNALIGLPGERVEKLAKDSKKGRQIKRLLKNPDRLVQTNLVIRTMVIMLLAGVMTERLFLPVCQGLRNELSGGLLTLVEVLTAALIIAASAVIISTFGVNIPKGLCLGGKLGERFALRTFWIYRLYLFVFRPFQAAYAGLSGGFLRLCGVKKIDIAPIVTGEELMQLLDAANKKGTVEDDQAEMISNIFEFSDMELHEAMTHRTEICAIELGAPLDEAVRASVESGYSRIPVYKETIDDICGILYIKDLLPLILEPNGERGSVGDYMHKVKYVPESGSCGELLDYFIEKNKQIAVVLDEYGGTAGIVTMEDLLECIVGNIRDEYDQNEVEEIQEITPHTFDILGSANFDDAMEHLSEEIDDDDELDYDTLGGFVTDLLGYIPESGQTPTVRWRDITFGVISAKENRIEKIRAVKDYKNVAALDEE